MNDKKKGSFAGQMTSKGSIHLMVEDLEPSQKQHMEKYVHPKFGSVILLIMGVNGRYADMTL